MQKLKAELRRRLVSRQTERSMVLAVHKEDDNENQSKFLKMAEIFEVDSHLDFGTILEILNAKVDSCNDKQKLERAAALF